MPSLPPEPDAPPTRGEQVAESIRHAARAVIGQHVAVRLIVFLALAVVGASFAPPPWSQIALLGLLGIAVEVAKLRVRSDTMQGPHRSDAR